jgi:hypothetical protein
LTSIGSEDFELADGHAAKVIVTTKTAKNYFSFLKSICVSQIQIRKN